MRREGPSIGGRRLLLLLIPLLVAVCANAGTLFKESEPRMCDKYECTRSSLRAETHSFIEDFEKNETRQVDCSNCKQCTASGYSFCMEAHKLSDQCLCAQEFPRGCTLAPRSLEQSLGDKQIVDLCYQSVIRNPPPPTATNEQNDVLVTIEQFWQKPYWRHMKLENLTLYYEFSVQNSDQCDGMVTTVKRQSGETSGYLCTPSLHIELEEEAVEPKEKADGVKAYEEYDDTMPPEIQFERDVFDGAPYVRFYYRIQVRRERQMSMRRVLTDRMTTLTSEVLQFDLRPTTKAEQAESEAPTSVFVESTTLFRSASSSAEPAVRKVNIEHRPQPAEGGEGPKGADSSAHLTAAERANSKTPTARIRPADASRTDQGQWRLVVWVAIVTFVVCLLLIAATVIYRRLFNGRKNAGETKPTATKQMNGHEYRATIQDER
ncbi:Protein kinase domain-containing protein [Aphelenchoides fujianensis]|nr:Protein kinase domain-containing protein [Aphelenchoides fujianensis]